ncbi:hypothetical protein ACFFX0_08260 [Citricoccus parietis]|uniref:Uncharacterized protein n=1 Tax=Citricoccus parietis TaxID=592307 RepID=A0ABV5FWY7_9MICC
MPPPPPPARGRPPGVRAGPERTPHPYRSTLSLPPPFLSYRHCPSMSCPMTIRRLFDS